MARERGKCSAPAAAKAAGALGAVSPLRLFDRSLSSIAEQAVRVVAVEIVDGNRARVRLAGLGVDDFAARIIEHGDLPARAAASDADEFLLGAAVQFERSEAFP